MLKKLLSALGFDAKNGTSPSPRDPSSQHSPEQAARIPRTPQSNPQTKTYCYVCHLPLAFPYPIETGTSMECPRCGIRNVITDTGRTNRPERIEIYKRYNGDLYDHSKVGLVGELVASFDAELKDLHDRKKQNLLDQKDYRKLYQQIRRRRETMLADLDRQKSAELHWLLSEEKNIRKKLGIKSSRADKLISADDIEL